MCIRDRRYAAECDTQIRLEYSPESFTGTELDFALDICTAAVSYTHLSAFRWQEHYLLIQGTRGAIKIDMCSCGMTLKTGEKEEHFLVHRTKEDGAAMHHDVVDFSHKIS